MRLVATAQSSGFDLHHQPPQLTPEMQACIDACLACHRSCEQMVIHCLFKGGSLAEADHIRTLLDCSQICRVSADFMLRQSNLSAQICTACALACQACADDCRRMNEDESLWGCIDICESCADLCQSLSQQH